MNKKAEPPSLLDLEQSVRDIGNVMRKVCPPDACFALFLFSKGEGGFTTYTSNASREQMIKAIEETLAHLKTGAVAPHGLPGHPANKRGEG